MKNLYFEGIWPCREVTAGQQGRMAKKTVLSEEDYLTCLSYLLRRDFYPNLDPLTTSSFSDILSSSVRSSTVTSSRRTSQRLSPAEVVAKHGIQELRSVDEFQSRFTSEDDASFNSLLRRENETRRARWREHFGTDKPLIEAGQRTKHTERRKEVGLLCITSRPSLNLRAITGRSTRFDAATPSAASSATSLSPWSRGLGSTPVRSHRRSSTLNLEGLFESRNSDKKEGSAVRFRKPK